MALFETHRSPVAVPSNGLFTALFSWVADWSERRATKAALMSLSDRELDDIGLTRGEVERAL